MISVLIISLLLYVSIWVYLEANKLINKHNIKKIKKDNDIDNNDRITPIIIGEELIQDFYYIIYNKEIIKVKLQAFKPIKNNKGKRDFILSLISENNLEFNYTISDIEVSLFTSYNIAELYIGHSSLPVNTPNNIISESTKSNDYIIGKADNLISLIEKEKNNKDKDWIKKYYNWGDSYMEKIFKDNT